MISLGEAKLHHLMLRLPPHLGQHLAIADHRQLVGGAGVGEDGQGGQDLSVKNKKFCGDVRIFDFL